MRRENNHRAHPIGVIQVKKDSSNKNILLRSEGETSDGASAASFWAKKLQMVFSQ